VRTPVDSLKRCASCGESKPLDQFYSRGKRPGHSSYCKLCANKKRNEWGKANPEKNKTWNQNHEARRTPEQRYDKKLQVQFKMTLADYNEMLADQEGLCAACQNPPADGQRLHVDHDHACCDTRYTCGKCVRGLLCLNCNAALGHVRDSKERLMNLIDYLEGTPGQCKAVFL
jgi:hypothetical protein